MIRILGIAPYPGLKAVMEALVKDMPDVELTAYIGDYTEGRTLALAEDLSSYDAILSRGGTADQIRSVASIPVIEIELSYYDILSAFKLAESYHCKFAFVGFPSTSQSVRMLCELLEYDVPVFTASDDRDVAEKIRMLEEKKIPLVLGDTMVAKYAEERGLHSIHITSGSRSVASALQHARELVLYGASMKRTADHYHTALISSGHALALYGRDRALLFSDIPDADRPVFLQIGRRVYQEAFGKEEMILLRKNGKKLIRVHTRKILEREEPCMVMEFETLPDQYLKKDPESSQIIGSFYYGDPWRQHLETASRVKYVIICGEPGTGKDAFADELHRRGSNASTPLISVDCGNLSDTEWAELIEGDRSPLLAPNADFCLEGLKRLSPAKLTVLLRRMKSCRSTAHVFIILNDGELIPDIQRYFDVLTLQLPPLRKRIHEIPAMMSRYISRLNARDSREIAGIEPEGISFLQSFSWPGNFRQFARVLNLLYEAAQMPYIRTEQVKTVLEGERVLPPPANVQIDLSQSLQHIIQEIIQTILHEEGMTKTKAAKRLEICRATLWKYLKQ